MHLRVCGSRRRRCRLCMEPYKPRSKAKQTPAPDTLLGVYYMHLLARAQQSVVPEQGIHVIILVLGCIFAFGVLVVVVTVTALVTVVAATAVTVVAPASKAIVTGRRVLGAGVSTTNALQPEREKSMALSSDQSPGPIVPTASAPSAIVAQYSQP